MNLHEALTSPLRWKWVQEGHSSLWTARFYVKNKGSIFGRGLEYNVYFGLSDRVDLEDEVTFPPPKDIQDQHKQEAAYKALNQTATWDVNFELVDADDFSSHMGVTNTGSSFAVFATVANIMKDFIQKNPSVNLLFFSSDYSRGRLSLYQRLTQMLSNRYGYSFYSWDTNQGIGYLLTQKLSR